MNNFTKAVHFKDAYIVNGNNDLVPTRFTIISRLEGDTVYYKASFCSASEKQFKKKDGVKYAQLSPEWSFPISKVDERGEGHNHQSITACILSDMAENHIQDMPYNHRRWFNGDNFGSDLEEAFMLDMMINDILSEAVEQLSSD